MTAMEAGWPQMVRRAGDAAAMTLQAVSTVGLSAVRPAVSLFYGPAVDLPSGDDLVEVLLVLASAIAHLGELQQISATQVVNQLVADAAGERDDA